MCIEKIWDVSWLVLFNKKKYMINAYKEHWMNAISICTIIYNLLKISSVSMLQKKIHITYLISNVQI